jgi:predicted DNA-binding transcriptional regulator YafY
MVLMLQSRPNMTSRDLADHFGVSRRTIFRDLRVLSESGVPLTYAEDGGYEILEGYQLPPLMLSAREASTPLIGIEFMKLQPDTGLRTDADHVEMKIIAILPPETRQYIDDLKARIVLDPYWLHASGLRGDDESRWHELSHAVTDRRTVTMEYFVPSRDEVTQRTVDPLGIIYYTDHWNLIAFDHLRNEVRNFRLDRIQSMRVASMSRFTPPDDFDLEAYIQRLGAPEEQPVEIFFDREVAGHARRTVPARIRDQQSTDAGIVVRFGFENLTYLAQWLLRFGVHAEVRSPKSLRKLVKEEAARVAAKY